MKLKPRERNLAIMLAAVVFLLVNLFLLPRLHTGNTEARKNRAELDAQLRAAEVWLDQRDYWREREEWLARELPDLDASGIDSAAQLELLQQHASESGVELRDISLLTLEPTPTYRPIGVRFSAIGPWKSLVHFLTPFQDPSTFDVIPRISIRSDQEPPNVFCEMELQSWFQPESRP